MKKHLYSLCLIPYWSTLVLLLPFSSGSWAIDLTLEQWDALQKKPLANNLMAMEKSGLNLDTPVGILSASKLIESFARQSKLTGKQIHQLNRWRRSDAEIKVVSAQDPKILEVHIQIGPQAKVALKAIRSNALANELYEKWQADQFTSDDLLALKGTNKKQAFIAFFNRLPPFLQTGFADWSMEQVKGVAAYKSGDFNHVFAHMAMITADADIARFVIEKLPANEASFALLKAISVHFDEVQQVALLKAAAEKSKMRTLSFNLLAEHFADDVSVAAVIARAMEERDSYWQALIVLPAFVRADNIEAFERVAKRLPEAQQAQIYMRLQKE